jgi:hypothetical protein
MPRSALKYVDADCKVKGSEVSELLVRLANEPLEEKYGRKEYGSGS